jgi:hypothetical protein
VIEMRPLTKKGMVSSKLKKDPLRSKIRPWSLQQMMPPEQSPINLILRVKEMRLTNPIQMSNSPSTIHLSSRHS